MSTETISDSITVTREPDGKVRVEAYARLPIDPAVPDQTFRAAVFSGLWAPNGFAVVSYTFGSDTWHHLPIASVQAEDAAKYLTALAELALAANGVTA